MKVTKVIKNKKYYFCGYDMSSSDNCVWANIDNAWNMNSALSWKLINYLMMNSAIKESNHKKYGIEK